MRFKLINFNVLVKTVEENKPKMFIKLPKLYIDKSFGDSNSWLELSH